MVKIKYELVYRNMNNFPSIVGGGRKKRKNKSSACIHLKKENCKFPCRRVRSNKKKGTCRTRFSEKVDYLNLKTQKVIRGRRKKRKTREGKNKIELRKEREKMITSEELQPTETPSSVPDNTITSPENIEFEHPVDVEEPAVVEEPVAVEEPATVVEEPAAAVEEPTVVEEPAVVEEPPAAVEEPPSAVEEPVVENETAPVSSEENKGVLGSIADGISSIKDSMFGEAKKEEEKTELEKSGGTRRIRKRRRARSKSRRRKTHKKNIKK